MTTNRHRKDVEFTLNGQTIVCRATLGKINEVETEFGSVGEIIEKFKANTFGVGRMVRLVTMIMRGAPGAPPVRELPEAIYASGPFSHSPAAVDWLVAATQSDEPVAEDAAGN